MTTVSISKKEYDSLIFAKTAKKESFMSKRVFNDSAFGIFKKVKTNSVALVTKLRKSWR